MEERKTFSALSVKYSTPRHLELATSLGVVREMAKPRWTFFEEGGEGAGRWRLDEGLRRLGIGESTSNLYLRLTKSSALSA